MNNSISSLIAYRKCYHKFKSLIESGLLEAEICNIALVGIAKDLGVLNPILL